MKIFPWAIQTRPWNRPCQVVQSDPVHAQLARCRPESRSRRGAMHAPQRSKPCTRAGRARCFRCLALRRRLPPACRRSAREPQGRSDRRFDNAAAVAAAAGGGHATPERQGKGGRRGGADGDRSGWVPSHGTPRPAHQVASGAGG